MGLFERKEFERLKDEIFKIGAQFLREDELDDYAATVSHYCERVIERSPAHLVPVWTEKMRDIVKEEWFLGYLFGSAKTAVEQLKNDPNQIAVVFSVLSPGFIRVYWPKSSTAYALSPIADKFISFFPKFTDPKRYNVLTREDLACLVENQDH